MTTRRALGAVLVVLAAALGVAATFLTFRYIEIDVGQGSPLRFEEDAWTVSRNDFPGGRTTPPPRFGLPILAGAVLLALGGLLSTRLPLARYGALIGAGLLFGAAWTAQEYHDSKVAEFAFQLQPDSPVQLHTGDGLLALIVATGLALVGAAAIQEYPPRQPKPEPPADDVVIHQIEDEGSDEDTPPYGFPVVVEEPK
ncbi:hypothetical protein FKR81_12320 [Lentzea tibetensis]|uniref:Tryptophan-associated transmembrane protein (Trp_oprn_chp) n=1 Tax=Lentzea tibetensis TaxID=2591470 RepID=A0A563EXR3_9PSEU|nr:hypothetical protein [Lentzea tibetensis]TWP52338.1 hypothetical protein FKR81_12320 [Lentzea tibetensis]